MTEQEAVRIGQILNIHKMVTGTVNIVSGQYNVDVRVLDVQTSGVDYKDGETWIKGTSYRELMRKLANRLMLKMNYQPSAQSNYSNSNQTSTSNSVITLFGYLKVFPDNIGEFSSVPINVISTINQQSMYGYNDWRLPTREEFALLVANREKLGLKNGNYMTSEDRFGNVRLVTTATNTANEKKSVRQEVINSGKGVEIGGVIWATGNIGTGGFVSPPREKGNFYNWHQTQNICPNGWRLPTKKEFEKLINYIKTRYSNGIDFGIGNNTIFLSFTAGPEDSRPGHSYYMRDGAYWSSTTYPSDNDYAYSLLINDRGEPKIDDYSGRVEKKESFGLTCRCVLNE